MTAAGIESDYGDWLKDWKRPDREVTTHVECAEYFDLRDRALLAHATQVDPDGGWFHAPRDLVREGWPTEEYELVVSYAPVQLPEDDLFAGTGVGPRGRRARGQGRSRPGPRHPAGPGGCGGEARQHVGARLIPDGHPVDVDRPGLGAFIAFFVLAVVLWLLMRNMNGRMRRMAYKEQQRVAELEAREAEREAADGPRQPRRPGPADVRAGSGRGQGRSGAVDRERRRDVVRDEGQHGEGVEDLVEPEPAR